MSPSPSTLLTPPHSGVRVLERGGTFSISVVVGEVVSIVQGALGQPHGAVIEAVSVSFRPNARGLPMRRSSLAYPRSPPHLPVQPTLHFTSSELPGVPT